MKKSLLLSILCLFLVNTAICQFTYDSNNNAVLVNEDKSLFLKASTGSFDPKLRVASIAKGTYQYGQAGEFSFNTGGANYYLHLLQNFSGAVGILRATNGSGDQLFNFGYSGGLSLGNSSTYNSNLTVFGNSYLKRSLIVGESTVSNNLNLTVNGKSFFTNDVVIGSSSCSSLPSGFKLGVKGGIICENMKVKLEGGNCWADYVFDDTYRLKPLSEVEQYISLNKHLPDVPSAAEVSENGINVAEMDAVLLQKIEELTLYMIEMKKELKEVQASNEELKEKNAELKEAINELEVSH